MTFHEYPLTLSIQAAQAPAEEKPAVLTKTKSGRVTKAAPAAKAAPKKAAPKKAAAPKKEKTPKKADKAEAASA